jgi:hypothetical protein
LVAELLENHYDPAYIRSLAINFGQASRGPAVELSSPDLETFRRLARRILDGKLAPAKLKM